MLDEPKAIRQSNAQVWERDENDWYCEADGIWRAFFGVEKFFGTIYDPFCGRGNAVVEAISQGYTAIGSDIVTRSERPTLYENAIEAVDFAKPESFKAAAAQIGGRVDNIIGNPPFKMVDPRSKAGKETCLLRLSLQRAERKVALLMPSAWLSARYWLSETPFYRVYHLSPRPPMPPGNVFFKAKRDGKRLSQGKNDMSIYVWMHGFNGDATVHFIRRPGKVWGES